MEIDGRADIYSLGLVFYEMIAGRRCYTAKTLHELRREHVSTVPKPLHEVVPSVPRGFSEAIQRATAKDRADRQPTAAVLASELKSGLNTHPFPTASPTSNEFAETIAEPRSQQTNSDVNAPTVVGMDASDTSVPSGSVATTPPAAVEVTPQPVSAAQANVSMASDTVIESRDMASSITVQKPPIVVAPAPPPPARSKSGTALIVGTVILIFLLVGVGIGGFFIYRRFAQTSTTTSAGTTVPPNAAPIEVSRYWLMLEPSTRGGSLTRVAGLVPLASGQSFQMRFVFAEDGYVYIFGPGQGNQPTAFLTTKPSAQTGLSTNEAKAGQEFSFPHGDQLLGLDKKPGTDRFTVIFSKTKLEFPSFLSAQVTGEPLPTNQLAEFNAFVSKYTQKAPVMERDDSNNESPFVGVKVESDKHSDPVVFEIRIQHN